MVEGTTGVLHVVRLTGAVDPVMAEYRIVFVPLRSRPRGRHVTRQGLDALTDFLRLAGVALPEIERAWRTLARHRFHPIPGVTLTSPEIEALGL